MHRTKKLKMFFLIITLFFFCDSHQKSYARKKVKFCEIEIEERAAGSDLIPAYIDDLNKTQKITQEKSNCISELIQNTNNPTDKLEKIIELYNRLIFQPKKVKGILREVDNKNIIPDADHLTAAYELVKEIKLSFEKEIKDYRDSKRKLSLKSKSERAYKKGKYNRKIFTKAEENELADLIENAPSTFQDMGESGVEERNRKIEAAENFMEKLKNLAPSLATE